MGHRLYFFTHSYRTLYSRVLRMHLSLQPLKCEEIKRPLHFHGSSMQPTDSDTSASQWSLCCVRFPTDSAVCLWARGAGGIPGETHSWEVIEFEGRREEERIVQAQWTYRK